jgi:hypothetical protein
VSVANAGAGRSLSAGPPQPFATSLTSKKLDARQSGNAHRALSSPMLGSPCDTRKSTQESTNQAHSGDTEQRDVPQRPAALCRCEESAKRSPRDATDALTLQYRPDAEQPRVRGKSF